MGELTFEPMLVGHRKELLSTGLDKDRVKDFGNF
jgi:hypothetical protein